jgi:hypothetical protein
VLIQAVVSADSTKRMSRVCLVPVGDLNAGISLKSKCGGSEMFAAHRVRGAANIQKSLGSSSD